MHSNFLLGAVTTDNGGGGTLDGFNDELKKRKVCRPDALTSPCAIYIAQLQLKRPVETLLGKGKLEHKTMMQMLHSAFDLEQSLNAVKWRRILDMSVDCCNKRLAEASPPANPDAFDEKFTFFMTFRKFCPAHTLWPPKKDDEGNEVLSHRKIPAAILTRWHTVGEVTEVIWHGHSLIFRILQCIINIHGASSSPGIIVSGMFPLMMEPEIFSDLALTWNCHKACFTVHMSWLMACAGIAKPGFIVHQMLNRHFLMWHRLTCLETQILTCHPKFKEFRKTLNRPGVDRDVQSEKASGFVELALESLHKHFKGFACVQLLPVALLSENPCAKVVARVILNIQEAAPELAKFTLFSEAHRTALTMGPFETFVRNRHMENDMSLKFPPIVIAAAEQVLDDTVDLHDLTAQNTSVVQKHFWSHCLAAASNTQFVERGVKEARNVSSTNRSEELRSVCTICRSSLVLTKDEEMRKLLPWQLLQLLMWSASNHCTQIEALSKRPDCKDSCDEVCALLRSNHCKEERHKQVLERVERLGNIARKENKRQLKAGVDRATVIAGLVPYSSVTKGTKMRGHQEDMMMELRFRGCAEEKINYFFNGKWNEMKDWLKPHETKRVTVGRGSAAAIVTAKSKAFEPQSEAKFKPLD